MEIHQTHDIHQEHMINHEIKTRIRNTKWRIKIEDGTKALDTT